MRLPPFTAVQGLVNLSVWFRGVAPGTGTGLIAVTDLECIQDHGLNVLYCMNCPLAFGGCARAA